MLTGNGVNEARALPQADVGIAILQLSRATYRNMIQNPVWATGCNVVAIPRAASAGIVAVNACLLSLKKSKQ